MYGGKPKYRANFPAQALVACQLGATDPDLARLFDVSTEAITLWKHRHKAFKAALDAGKPVADDQVEASLFKRANGYEDSKGQHHPGDVTAMIFWLKNRRPDAWRDRREHHLGGSLKIEAIEMQVIDPAPTIIEAGDIGATNHPAPLIEHKRTTTNGRGGG